MTTLKIRTLNLKDSLTDTGWSKVGGSSSGAPVILRHATRANSPGGPSTLKSTTDLLLGLSN